MPETQKCPVCSSDLPYCARYPNYLCVKCSSRAADETGRPLEFANTTPLGGGFAARYADTGENRDSHICYIDNIRCRADEARFGGIVIRPFSENE